MSDRERVIRKCQKCGEPFEATIYDPGGPFRDPETLDCPYCGHEVERRVMAGTMHSRKLTDEERAAYDAKMEKS
jgi:endogenous inhibitor of DNA gyrase (YacG/DUF329 family)